MIIKLPHQFFSRQGAFKNNTSRFTQIFSQLFQISKLWAVSNNGEAQICSYRPDRQIRTLIIYKSSKKYKILRRTAARYVPEQLTSERIANYRRSGPAGV